MGIILEYINGYEILEFLNKEIMENDDLCDISPCGPFIFEGQVLENDIYNLSFTAFFNNWGEHQPINGNEIVIYKNGLVKVLLDEPFEGDGSDDELENILLPWLANHTFKKI